MTRMVAIRKYLFDTVFDTSEAPAPEPKAESDQKAQQEVEDQAEEEEIPTYSQEDLAVAQQEGFATGKEEGLREATGATERQLAESLAAVGQHLSGLFDIQARANTVAAADAVTVAATIARKIFPHLTQRGGLGEIERMVEASMQRVLDEPRVVIRVNGALRDSLAEHIEALTAGSGHEGKVTLLADDEVPVGDCRVVWVDGGAERNTAAMWQEIDAIIERNIADPRAAVGAEDSQVLAAEAPAGGGAAGGGFVDTVPESDEPAVAAAEAPEPADTPAPIDAQDSGPEETPADDEGTTGAGQEDVKQTDEEVTKEAGLEGALEAGDTDVDQSPAVPDSDKEPPAPNRD